MSTTTWNIDPTHSEVGFKVRHLMISNVKGNFGKYTASLSTEGDDLTTAQINFEAEVASINTNNEQRDGHLKSGDFFDAEQFPHIKFSGSEVVKKDEHNYTVKGNLEIRSIAKPVELNVISSGIAKDPWGQSKIAFEISGKINRSEYGLTWNAPLEAGGVLLSDEIHLNAEVQFVKA
jgi:polyisoprenoid-binding protein YceI